MPSKEQGQAAAPPSSEMQPNPNMIPVNADYVIHNLTMMVGSLSRDVAVLQAQLKEEKEKNQQQ